MSYDKLLAKINEIKNYDNDFWSNSLSNRKKKELEFHDRDRDKSKIEESVKEGKYEEYYGNVKYYETAKRSRTYIKKWINTEAKDKVFLDYACGNGENAIIAAQSNAKLSIGMDISSISVKNGEEKSKKLSLKNIIFYQGDAENTLLPDNSVDVILCSEMLHHLDLSFAFFELRRILKPGGKILAVEALDYNPFIKLYRKLTPSMRTEWESEHILSFKEIKFAERFFQVKNIKFWHVIGYVGGKLRFLSFFLERIDKVLEKIPLINRLAWMFTFELHKKKEDEN